MKKNKALNKLNIGQFEAVNKKYFKSSSADAVVLTKKELINLIRERVCEEIPYIGNEVLKKYLPERFNFRNDFMLSELKELAKFDHTMVSNHILDMDLFVYDILNNHGYTTEDLILEGSVNITDENYCYFISQIEKPS